MSGWSESNLIEHFRRIPIKDPSVVIGPGDDCAVLQYTSGKYVLTTDLIAQDVDFVLSDTDIYLIGRKCIMISASDIAAMGCYPLHFVVASQIPSQIPEAELMRLWQGMYDAAEQVDASIVGGDLSSGDKLVMVSTAMGKPFASEPLLRSGARIGDGIYVTGVLGGSILGHHLNSTPRLDAAKVLSMGGYVNSMADVSDGLSGDLCHIADASRVDFAVDASRIPISDAAKEISVRDGVSPLLHALNDGEDFELVFTISQNKSEEAEAALLLAGISATRIGTITDFGTGRFLLQNNNRIPWVVGSYEHR